MRCLMSVDPNVACRAAAEVRLLLLLLLLGRLLSLLGLLARLMGGPAVVSFALGRLAAASFAFAGVPRVPILCLMSCAAAAAA